MDLIRFKYGENNINTGPLKEIPEICIDHFFGNDLDSSVFLLSHAHTGKRTNIEVFDYVYLSLSSFKITCFILFLSQNRSFSRP